MDLERFKLNCFFLFFPIFIISVHINISIFLTRKIVKKEENNEN